MFVLGLVIGLVVGAAFTLAVFVGLSMLATREPM